MTRTRSYLLRLAVACCAVVFPAVLFPAALSANDVRPTVAPLGKLLPAERTPAEVIDHYVDAKLQQSKVTPAPQIGDENFVRRVTLDLIGRIPTPTEVSGYVDSKEKNKREQLVDRLLDSPEFLDQQVYELDWLLTQGQGTVRGYLVEALRDGRSWERIFRDLMLSDAEALQRKGAVDFLKSRVKDPDRLTNDVSSAFFGVNISCAQCHDHPLVDDWKQGHFYGFKSFFNRTFENGDFLGEREYGLVSYQTPKGEQKQAELMFLSGRKVVEPAIKEPDNKAKKTEQDELKKLADKKLPPPAPKFSRRSALVETALRAEERSFFARSIVNRVWHRLLGRGLVMPVDQMHSGNPASHPELLEWLARDAAEHDFDLRRLMRGMVLSRVYARSSKWESGDRPAPETFAVANVRPLTPWQYSGSLRLATADPEMWLTLKTPKEITARAKGLTQSSRAWASSFASPSDDFQVNVTEALLLANDPKVEAELLSEGNDRLVGRMLAVKDPTAAVEAAFTAVLNRKPDAEERASVIEYLTERKDRAPQAARQVVWTLLTGSEMRFNY